MKEEKKKFNFKGRDFIVIGEFVRMLKEEHNIDIKELLKEQSIKESKED